VKKDGRTVLRFEVEPRPGVLAEEIAHLEQLADPKFARKAGRLSDASGPGYESFTTSMKVEAHKARLELEIDAQKRVIDKLMEPGRLPKGQAARERVIQDTDTAFNHLEALRNKLARLEGAAKRVGEGGTAPDFIEQTPTLHNKQGRRRALPAKWKSMTQREFVAAYKKKYPETSLTDADLKLRYKNGQRLGPKGRMRDPTLVDKPDPDFPAVAQNEVRHDPASLKVDKRTKLGRDIQQQLEARDVARAKRQKQLGKGDESGAAKTQAEINEASRQIGEAYAKVIMQRPENAGFTQVYPPSGAASRAGDFDQVWVKHHPTRKGRDGKPKVVEVIVIEAKGGTSPLGARKVNGKIAQQGSSEYFDGILGVMAKGDAAMQSTAAQIASVPRSKVKYKYVRAKMADADPAYFDSTVVAVEEGDFKLK